MPQDNDGYVSQEDYKVAKRFDFDGNGILDANEKQACKKVLAEEFFRNNADDMEYLGPEFAQNSFEQNVDMIANARRFDI